MMRFLKLIPCLLIFLLMCSCGDDSSKESGDSKAQHSKHESVFDAYYNSIFTVTTYDGDRELEKISGFFVTEKLAVSSLSAFMHANRAKIRLQESGETRIITQFKAMDRNRDLILFSIDSLVERPIALIKDSILQSTKLYNIRPKRGYVIPMGKGVYLSLNRKNGPLLHSISNRLKSTDQGTPIFTSNGKAIGMGINKKIEGNWRSFAIPTSTLLNFVNKNKNNNDKRLESIYKVDQTQSKKNEKIKRVIIHTNKGEIALKLFNNMPQYRDNFVKLIQEGFYKDLLFHRVIRGFVIQGGAADSRFANAGDRVGWQGPGYTLPANINPNKFNKRGMLGAPRLPDRNNEKKRSNGSQFYIVEGRRYNDTELNDIEKQQHKKFSTEEREYYKRIGGAPTLDGEYTLFGKVVSGMEIVDEISKVLVDKNYRPKEDLRIRNIDIVW